MLDQKVRYTVRGNSMVITIAIAIVTLLAALFVNTKLLCVVKGKATCSSPLRDPIVKSFLSLYRFFTYPVRMTSKADRIDKLPPHRLLVIAPVSHNKVMKLFCSDGNSLQLIQRGSRINEV